MPSQFDDLSWDILHSIFDYLNPLDLLNGFVHINAYFDALFNAYRRIRIDCKEIKKSTFISICQHINLNQIQALRLSNNESTPGQIQLFMSLVPLIQCSNLQYLQIEQINDINLLCSIFSHIEDHSPIHSLSISECLCEISKTNARYISQCLTTLSSLRYLTIPRGSVLSFLREPLFELTHLTIEHCRRSDLQMSFPKVPNLVYLHISIPYDDSSVRFDYLPEQLTSLIIRSKVMLSFDDIENILSLTPCLRHLTLDTLAEPALLNGQRWESLIKSKLADLKELRIDIHPVENQITGDHVLQSFQSSFWTIEKRWYMACFISSLNQACVRLSSMPYFAPTRDWFPQSEGFANLSLTPFPFNDHIKHIELTQIPSDEQVDSPWKSLETLSVYVYIDNLEQLGKLVNLSSITHLILWNCLQGPVFSNVLQALHKLRQLTIMGKASGHVLEVLAKIPCAYHHIKKLAVRDLVLRPEDIDRISQILPKLEYIKLSMRNQGHIPHAFEKLKHLKSATIDWAFPLRSSLDQTNRFLEENEICTDGAYTYANGSLSVWIS